MGLLNIICSPYLFFSQQAFNLTPRARFVLLPAPRFPFLKASVFVFVPEGDPLCLCVDTCAGGAAAGTVDLPRAPQPRQRVRKGSASPGTAAVLVWGTEGRYRAIREGALAVLSSPLLEQRILVGWTTAVFTLRGFLLPASHQPSWRGTHVAGAALLGLISALT